MANLKNIPSSGTTELIKLAGKLLNYHQDVRVDPHAPLDKKSNRPEVLAQLARLEEEILARAKAQGLI